jgi:hypothetical protein
MKSVDEAVRELQQLMLELQQDGQQERAARLSASVSAILSEAQGGPGELLTTGQAAEALGVRSVNTIKRWASDGLLEGFHRGGRVLVSSRSVDALRNSKVVNRRTAVEGRINEVLSAFDDGDDAPHPSELTMAWTGRKPWEQSRRHGQRSAHATSVPPSATPDRRH